MRPTHQSPHKSLKNTAERGKDRRAVFAKTLIRLFEFWQLDSADQLTLLGLAQGNRIALQRYAKGEPIAASRDALDRAGHLFGIQKGLELLYPRNMEIQQRWMSASNTKFGGQRPVDIVSQYGLPGLVMVRGTLDVMRGQ